MNIRLIAKAMLKNLKMIVITKSNQIGRLG